MPADPQTLGRGVPLMLDVGYLFNDVPTACTRRSAPTSKSGHRVRNTVPRHDHPEPYARLAAQRVPLAMGKHMP
ncbi:MAG: hypothetical protein U0992_22760 [Planctomycetaceae bacterium]